MKRFMAIVALQPGRYDKVKYEPKSCPKTMDYPETRIPVLPMMNAVVSEGERIQVTLIATHNSQTEKKTMVKQGDQQIETTVFNRNLGYTKDEINAWAKKKGVTVEYYIIDKDEPADMKQLLSLFKELIECIEKGYSEDDIFYGDITFGQKPVSMTLLYALRYARAVKRNVLGHIVYGQVYRVNKLDENGKEILVDKYHAKMGEDNILRIEKKKEAVPEQRGELHDLTSLFYMDSLVSRVAAMDIVDPVGIITWSLQNAVGKE